jgi:4-hydroxybenzoate polyprenyltransferase
MTENKSSYSDIDQAGWTETLPHPYRAYARLMRLDRPIGTWLLLLPCWWGVALTDAVGKHVLFMFLFAAGAVIMRGAGCVVNDLYDRDLDRKVERTRTRPLASGEITFWQAMVFLGLLLLLGLGILLCFNQTTILTGAVSLVLVFTYPLMKRITWWPQLFLGLTFNWGVLLGGTAVTGSLDAAHLLAYAAGVCWTLAYDTFYAHQDARDDVKVGIKSTALLFGARSKTFIAGFYTLALVFLSLAGMCAGFHLYYFTGLAAAALFASAQMLLWRIDDPANCLRRFKANRDFGLIVLAAMMLGRI